MRHIRAVLYCSAKKNESTQIRHRSSVGSAGDVRTGTQYGILEIRLHFGRDHASLSYAAHAGLLDAARSGEPCATYAKWRHRACGTRAGEYAGGKNVCGVSRGISRVAGRLAKDGRHAL